MLDNQNKKILSTQEIIEYLAPLPGWAYADEALTKSFTFGTYGRALAFMLQVGLVSEKLNHHAIVVHAFTQVTLNISTHDAGGVTALDFEWIRLVEDLL